ncbi:MAG: hypothetical protein IPK12_16150 [Gemmatimonadetes bacterium]|nr:hypothetical protein [Gemmatimonadota bacterium]
MALIDPASSNGCLTLPASGPLGAEYLVTVYSANGQVVDGGASGAYALNGAALAAPRAAARSGGAEDAGLAFEARLRAEEVRLASAAVANRRQRRPAVRRPPSVGDTRTFSVCASIACAGFVPVQASARFVGTHVALFVDDTVAAGGFSPAELDSLGVLADSHLFPLDTTAFGAPSDLDGNGVVIVLLTDRVNALSNCSLSGGIVRGYFSSRDLTQQPGSNQGEIVYGMVPDPAQALCFGKVFVRANIAPTVVHELQHLISYNRHVLLGNGQPEASWLNEGLSHFAEELAGRTVPPMLCPSGNCLNQFAAGNIRNAFTYLSSPGSYYLVYPRGSTGSLGERGAAWLFVRWLADRSLADTVLATDVTRRLLGADQAGGLALTGGANVAAALQRVEAGITFPTLAGRWHLSNWTERVPGFSEPSGWLRYRSWDLPLVFDQLFPGPYPLRPDSTSGAPYAAAGTLLGGSATYLRVVQPPSGEPVGFLLDTRNTAEVLPRLAVVRLR